MYKNNVLLNQYAIFLTNVNGDHCALRNDNCKCFVLERLMTQIQGLYFISLYYLKNPVYVKVGNMKVLEEIP